MERMLWLWDELDDWMGVGRHVLLRSIAGSFTWVRFRRSP
jgi:hypothetical protein